MHYKLTIPQLNNKSRNKGCNVQSSRTLTDYYMADYLKWVQTGRESK